MSLILTPPPADAARKPHSREAVLDRILNDPRLPTPPAVAMQIVQATSRADCEVKDIVELLASDPVICGQVLKVINSCVYGLTRAVTSIDRAVVLLGLNTVRSIVLTFSLPAMQLSTVPDKPFRDHCLSSVSGAIMARELTVRARKPFAEDDMVCGLLRDLGALLLRHTFLDEYVAFERTRADRSFRLQCALERDLFGVDHAEVSAELLKRWNLPMELVESIRFHHEPERGKNLPPLIAGRAELLAFVEGLTNLDLISQDAAELDRMLKYAEERHGMSREGLVEFLQGLMPKVTTFAGLLRLDVGASPDYAAILNAGCNELAMLAVQSGRIAVTTANRSTSGSTARTHSAGVADADLLLPLPAEPRPADAPLPFIPEFIDSFPARGCELDGYRLDQVIGRGAMGAVFRGYEPALDRHVAIKLMLPALARDENARQRFAREARSVAAVRHENVVAVYTVRDVDDTTYLVMEYVDGESLEDRLEREAQLPVPEVIEVAAQVLAGLGAAHAKKIVHRDVKPANILFERATGRFKLTDFGLARVENDVKLSSGASLIGTPLYMAPEQVRGQTIDPRTDLFSLGSVLYALATGVVPFDARTTYTVLTNVCEHDPPPLRSHRSEVPAWFDQLVMKLLEKGPDDRFASAGDALRVIQQAQQTGEKKGGWKKWLGL
jgi:eukaryotic-like serine/threonine-protein kinase